MVRLEKMYLLTMLSQFVRTLAKIFMNPKMLAIAAADSVDWPNSSLKYKAAALFIVNSVHVISTKFVCDEIQFYQSASRGFKR